MRVAFALILSFVICFSADADKQIDNAEKKQNYTFCYLEANALKDPITIRKTAKHLGNDVQENITFWAKESRNKNSFIERDGVLMIRQNAPANILICHGFMCNKSDVGFLRFLFKDYNVMTFDFRAHGEKVDGQCCTFGKDEIYDVIAAVDYIKKHRDLKNKPLIVYGFSMGAVSAILAQAEKQNLFDAMILDCPFDSSDKIIERGINQLKVNVMGYQMAIPGGSVLSEYAYSPYVQSLLKYFFKSVAKMDATQINCSMCPVYPIEAIKKINVPCFIISCAKDEKVPPQAIMNIFHCAGTKCKRVWITNGIRHFDSFFYNPELYNYEVNSFIRKFLKGELKKPNQTAIFDNPSWERELSQK